MATAIAVVIRVRTCLGARNDAGSGAVRVGVAEVSQCAVACLPFTEDESSVSTGFERAIKQLVLSHYTISLQRTGSDGGEAESVRQYHFTCGFHCCA